jgi:hypothetical protein
VSTENDDPIRELVTLHFMDSFKLALRVHGALAQAFEERTGTPLERNSDYTTGDLKRAGRILRCEGRTPKGSRGNKKLAAAILQLRNPKEGA